MIIHLLMFSESKMDKGRPEAIKLKRFSCVYCSKEFNKKYGSNRHIKEDRCKVLKPHVDEFACTECNWQTNALRSLDPCYYSSKHTEKKKGIGHVSIKLFNMQN